MLAYYAHRFDFDLLLVYARLSRTLPHTLDRLEPKRHGRKVLKHLTIILARRALPQPGQEVAIDLNRRSRDGPRLPTVQSPGDAESEGDVVPGPAVCSGDEDGLSQAGIVCAYRLGCGCNRAEVVGVFDLRGLWSSESASCSKRRAACSISLSVCRGMVISSEKQKRYGMGQATAPRELWTWQVSVKVADLSSAQQLAAEPASNLPRSTPLLGIADG
jgi:hypothetical protein